MLEDSGEWLLSSNLFQSQLFPAEDPGDQALKLLKPSDILKSAKASLRWSYTWGAPLLAKEAFWFSSDNAIRIPAVGSTAYMCLTKMQESGSLAMPSCDQRM